MLPLAGPRSSPPHTQTPCCPWQVGVGKHLVSVVLFLWDVTTDVVLARVRVPREARG